MLLAAAAGARAGGDAAAVAQRAREARAELKLWFALDTLEYLRRGGRIGGAQAWLGTALKIKPILSVESEIDAGRARADLPPRVRADGRRAARAAADGLDGWVVQHIGDREQAAGARASAGARSSAPSRCSSPRSAR